MPLSDKGIQFNEYTSTLFEHSYFVSSDSIEELNLVKANLSELELEESCSLDELSNCVSELGLKFCPLYLVAILRLNYMDLEKGLCLTIASIKPKSMKTILKDSILEILEIRYG